MGQLHHNDEDVIQENKPPPPPPMHEPVTYCQITQSIAGRPQSDTDSLVSSLVALYYFTAIVKLPLHKPIAR